MKDNKLIHRLKTQGYCNIPDSDLQEMAFGNRFAYIVCSSILLIGIVTASIPLLTFMMLIALFGVLLPFHPFDYIYNHGLSGVLKKPKIPKRSKQLKFACGIATTWIAINIYLIYIGLITASYVSGGLLFSVAFLVSSTDVCIPSIIYNFLFKYKVE